MKVRVTTPLKTNLKDKIRAEAVAQVFNTQPINRNKASLATFFKEDESPLLVVSDAEIVAHLSEKETFFFHPNSAMFRVIRLERKEYDPYIAISEMGKGMKVLDCTLGLASDAIAASYIVGHEGRVVGVESVALTAFIVKEGLKQRKTKNEAINEAMSRIEVIHCEALDYLKSCADNSFDIVFFDPMFQTTISTSTGLTGLKKLADYRQLNEQMIEQAKRVARLKVVLKDHYLSPLFNTYGFEKYGRKSAKFHFGVIDVQK